MSGTRETPQATTMMEQQDQAPEDRDATPTQQQQQQQPATEGHAGQGSDSAMKQMRLWEQRRASQSGGRGRQGPN
jgi:ABC-type uncharacterized transport system involved in gliding motility auxiliary subunit